MAKMTIIDWIAVVLLTIGGINWGIYGATAHFQNKPFDLVSKLGSLLGNMHIAHYIFMLVGIAGLYSLYWLLFRR